MFLIIHFIFADNTVEKSIFLVEVAVDKCVGAAYNISDT